MDRTVMVRSASYRTVDGRSIQELSDFLIDYSTALGQAEVPPQKFGFSTS